MTMIDEKRCKQLGGKWTGNGCVPKGWIHLGDVGTSTYWETKKRSKIYKGQPTLTLSLGRHPIDKNFWSFGTGQAAINMPKFKTREQAEENALSYMQQHSKGLVK